MSISGILPSILSIHRLFISHVALSLTVFSFEPIKNESKAMNFSAVSWDDKFSNDSFEMFMRVYDLSPAKTWLVRFKCVEDSFLRVREGFFGQTGAS